MESEPVEMEPQPPAPSHAVTLWHLERKGVDWLTLANGDFCDEFDRNLNSGLISNAHTSIDSGCRPRRCFTSVKSNVQNVDALNA